MNASAAVDKAPEVARSGSWKGGRGLELRTRRAGLVACVDTRRHT